MQVTFTAPDGTASAPLTRLDANSGYSATMTTTSAQAGEWTVRATWPGDAGTLAAAAPACVVRVATTTTTKLSCPGQVSAGSPIVVSGNLAPPRPGAQMALTYTRPDTSADQQVAPTDASGNFAASEATASGQTGSWRIVASYAGNADTQSSQATCIVQVVAPPPPGKGTSTISLTCPSGIIYESANDATLTGSISPPRASTPVTITYTNNGGASTPTTQTVLTDESSNYSDTTSLVSGSWTAQATWPGDAQYDGATSPSCSFTVYASPK